MFDCEEAARWLRQAEYTLRSIDADIDGGFYSWACFKSHQAAEYALKALLRAAGVESFGHDLVTLWRKAVNLCPRLAELKECITSLNKLYIPPRYPDAWAGDATPYENYTARDALEAKECAEKVHQAAVGCIQSACAEEEG